MKKITFIYILLFFFPVLSMSLFTQTTGSISGVVVDAKDSVPLIGAIVKIEGTKTGAVTDDLGQFVILNLTPGTYTLKVLYVGYDPCKISGVNVLTGERTMVDFKLGTYSGGMKDDIEWYDPSGRGLDPDVSGRIIYRDWIEQTGIR